MTNGKTLRGVTASKLSGAASRLAGATEIVTAPAIAEMTAAEIAMVAGGIELSPNLPSNG